MNMWRVYTQTTTYKILAHKLKLEIEKLYKMISLGVSQR